MTTARTALDGGAYDHGAELYFIDPGKSIQNAYIESFNGSARLSDVSHHMPGEE